MELMENPLAVKSGDGIPIPIPQKPLGKALSDATEMWQTPVGMASYRKLNLGCGHDKREGYVNVDVNPTIEPDVRCDLFTLPWPLPDNTFHEVLCSHLLEHVPPPILIPWMDELWRVCAPHAIVEIRGPYWASEKTWQDPTHFRGLCLPFFAYFSETGRAQFGVDHYPIRANFALEKTKFFLNPEWESSGDGAKAFAVKHYVNVVDELAVWLRAVKR
mgnify:CR=1 FL=1